jgi:hypothetical protein
VWINDRKRKRVWVGSKVSRDRFKWWGVGYVSALGRRDDMAADAAHFREAFAVVGVGGECARGSQESQEASNKSEAVARKPPSTMADARLLVQHHEADWIRQS